MMSGLVSMQGWWWRLSLNMAELAEGPRRGSHHVHLAQFRLLMAVEKCGAWRLNSAALGVKKHEGFEQLLVLVYADFFLAAVELVDRRLGVLESIAFALGLDDVTSVCQSIEGRSGEPLVAKNFRPVLKR